METQAIFKSTLRLIREGKIGYLSMAEIAYHARVSAATVQAIFETREGLICSLGRHVFGQISVIIERSLRRNDGFDDRYLDLWQNLTAFYRSNPDVVAFLDHFQNIPLDVEEVRQNEQMIISSLGEFFSGYRPGTGVFDAETIAILFHENAKITARCADRMNDMQARAFGDLILSGLDQMTTKSLEAA